MPDHSDIEATIASLHSWSEDLASSAEITDEEVPTNAPHPSTDRFLILLNLQSKPRLLLQNAKVIRHLKPAIKSLNSQRLGSEQLQRRVQQFFIDASWIGFMPHRPPKLARSELARELTALSRCADKLSKQLSYLSDHIGDSDDIGYLIARLEAGNPNDFLFARGYFKDYKLSSTTLRDLLPSLTGSIDELNRRIKHDIKANRKEGNSRAIAFRILKLISDAAVRAFGSPNPLLAIEIVSTLREIDLDTSQAYKYLRYR